MRGVGAEEDLCGARFFVAFDLFEYVVVRADQNPVFDLRWVFTEQIGGLVSVFVDGDVS